MRRAFLLCILFAATPLSALAQAASGTPLAGKLLITGSSTMAPMIQELARRFCAQHPGVAIVVEGGGSGRAVSDALNGKADIGMAARELTPKERALFAIPMARDGVVFVVHKDNRVGALTRAQAIEVFTGKIANWRALGGHDARIEAVTRAPDRAALGTISNYLGVASTAIKAAHVIGDKDDVVRLITANRNVIAFISIGAVHDAKQQGLPLKPLVLDGLPPGVGSIRDGTWPLARPLNLLTRRVPTGAAKAFIEFALSPAAREVILEHDFVPY